MTQPTLDSKPTARATFTNPIIRSRDAADPWVIRHGGDYYFTATLEPEGGLWVWRSATLTGLDQGEKVKVWHAHTNGDGQSAQIWAPELHLLHGKWYLYYTASDGIDAHHRHYVLEAEEPLGPYTDLGRVDPDFDQYAIDGSILALPGGELYFLYATLDGLWAAEMVNPWTVRGRRARIASGTHDWEREWKQRGQEWIKSGEGYWIEAPQALLRGGRVFVVYSAGHSATPEYYLGLLEWLGGDVLDPSAWVKRDRPLFGPYEGSDGAVYTPGHGSFTTSPDGCEDWLVYHAKDFKGTDFNGRRTRAQPFGWCPDGTPDLGRPVPSGVPLPRPSGE